MVCSNLDLEDGDIYMWNQICTLLSSCSTDTQVGQASLDIYFLFDCYLKAQLVEIMVGKIRGRPKLKEIADLIFHRLILFEQAAVHQVILQSLQVPRKDSNQEQRPHREKAA